MPTTTDRLLQVQSTLTTRDHTLLSWLYDHGVLTTDQISHALFGSRDFCQRRLLRLTSIGVITRFRPQKPDGGSFPYHYVIDQLGAEIVTAQRCEPPPRRDHARVRRNHLTAKANLPHLLGINQFFTDLAGHARTHPETNLDRWWPASRLQQPYGFLEPGDDRLTMGYSGTPVRPDAHGIWSHGPTHVAFYLEHDTGTETLHTLTDKIFAYGRLANLTGRVRPILFWLPTSARELHLHQRITEAFTYLNLPVATAARDHATTMHRTPAEDIWWLYGHTGARLPLAALSHEEPTAHTAHQPRGHL